MKRPDNIMHFDFHAIKRKIKQRIEAAELTDRLISCDTLADKLGVSRSTIYRWLKEGSLPKPMRKGKTVRWSENEIDLWWQTAKDKV